MNTLWKKTDTQYASSAKVVDGNLILSLPDAVNPVVWRMELGSVKASALEVKPSADATTYLLSLKTPKGEVHDIAPFQTREQAVKALMRVSAALQSAHGRISPVAAQAATMTTEHPRKEKEGGAGKWLLALAGVLLIIFLFAYIPSKVPHDDMAPSATGLNGEASGESGVPQSADQLLRGF